MLQQLRGLCNLTIGVPSRWMNKSLKTYSTMASKPLFEPTRPIHWVLDWDGTITQRDTLDSLVSIAASAKPDSSVLQEWQRVSEAYMLDYNNAIKKLAPNGELPKTVQDEKKLLLALASVEQASLDRVSASGIFAGLTRQLIEDGAKRLIDSKKVGLRKGVAPFLHSVGSRPREGMNLLSVNWSRHFIGACLRAAEAPLNRTSIYANELDGIEGGAVSHGYISPKNDAEMLIISSGDKLKYLNRLRNRYEESTNGLSVSSAPIVYVGDSWTDIECLLEADLGICIRDEPMGSSQKKLAERLESLGVRCSHLSDWKEAYEHQVVWASDFVEIQEWVGKHGTKSAE